MAVSLASIYPSIVQCFLVVIFGYLAGRLQIITKEGAAGLAKFVWACALPALLIRSIAILQLGAVRWDFIGAVVLSKGVIFLATGLVTLMLHRGPRRLSYAGLFGIFVTQSNDFALGYPLVLSLYKQTPFGQSPAENGGASADNMSVATNASAKSTRYSDYIYLVAPPQLLLFNMIGFVLLEVDVFRQKYLSLSPGGHDDNPPPSKVRAFSRLAGKLLWGIFTNPIIAGSILGIVANLALDAKLPRLLDDLLKTIGQSFSATALFFLGLSLVGHIQKSTLDLNKVLIIVGLISAKMLLLPIILREIVEAICNDNQQLGMFSFLYGTFPTAPSLVVFASQYNVVRSLVAAGMVLGTIIAAPLMFVAAQMISLQHVPMDSQFDILHLGARDVSAVSLTGAVWVLVYFLIVQRWRSPTHRVLLCIVTAHIITLIAVIIESIVYNHEGKSGGPTLVFIHQCGLQSSRLFAALLAGSLVVVYTKPRRVWDKAFQIATPIIIVVSIIIACVLVAGPFKEDYPARIVLDNRTHHSADMLEFPAINQAAQEVVSIIIIVICLAVIFVLAIALVRLHQKSATTASLGHAYEPAVHSPTRSEHIMNSSGGVTENTALLASRNLGSSTYDKRTQSMSLTVTGLRRHNSWLAEQQVERHWIYLAQVTLTMLVSFLRNILSLRLNLSKSTRRSASTVEIVFLDQVFTYGQAFFICILFGFNKLVFLKMQSLGSALARRFTDSPTIRQPFRLPEINPLTAEQVSVIQTFRGHYILPCCKAIARPVTNDGLFYPQVFTGHEFVSWLVSVGLAGDRVSAVNYARCLVRGRVLQHIQQEYDFQDSAEFYMFCVGKEEAEPTLDILDD